MPGVSGESFDEQEMPEVEDRESADSFDSPAVIDLPDNRDSAGMAKKFGPRVQAENLAALKEGDIPIGTRKQTKWALQRWNDCAEYRNSKAECVC